MLYIVIMDVITVLISVSVTIICDAILHLELNFIIDNDIIGRKNSSGFQQLWDEDFVTYVTQLWVYGPKQLWLH